MADVVRILGLDDDNHAPMFRMETGEIFNNPRELIKFLSHAHDVEYDVRMFAIVENYSGELLNYEPEEIDAMFYFLEGIEPWKEAEFDLTFNLFWESVNRSWW
jgi:hypothetical protein